MRPAYDRTEEVDPIFYCGLYPDLAHLRPEEAKTHFEHCGRLEGRIPSPGSVREHFLPSIPIDRPTLEIGPFANPALRGPAVRYADVFSKEELLENAKVHGLDPTGCPDIHYVLARTPLSEIPDKFFNVFSSHCIEHQTDLVAHLRDIGNMLEHGGSYFLIVPDKRFCFDHFLPDTTIADIMAAHMARRTTHDLKSLIAAAAMTTHNDAGRHWSGDHGIPHYLTDTRVVDRAVEQHAAAKGAYLDCHAWQFDPQSFGSLCQSIFDMSLTRLRPTAVYRTLRPRNEFCAVLTLDR